MLLFVKSYLQLYLYPSRMLHSQPPLRSLQHHREPPGYWIQLLLYFSQNVCLAGERPFKDNIENQLSRYQESIIYWSVLYLNSLINIHFQTKRVSMTFKCSSREPWPASFRSPNYKVV